MQPHPRGADRSSALISWSPRGGHSADGGRCVIRKSPSAICVTARGLARPWGAMEWRAEPVCVCVCVCVSAEAGPAERGPVDADPGRAPRLPPGRATRKMAHFTPLSPRLPSALPPRCLPCVSGCVHTHTHTRTHRFQPLGPGCGASLWGQARRSEVHPPGPPLMVLGACGHRGVAHV